MESSPSHFQQTIPQPAVLPPKLQAKSISGSVPAGRLEFDLPPPPPSQFLPDNEIDKIKIAELISQQHQHQSGQTRTKPEVRVQQQQVQFCKKKTINEK